jgi:hypothetical protein
MIIKWRESNSIHLHLKKSLTGQAYGKIQSLFPSKKPAMPARYHVIAAFLFVINSCTDTRDYVAVIPPGPPEIISGEKIGKFMYHRVSLMWYMGILYMLTGFLISN